MKTGPKPSHQTNQKPWKQTFNPHKELMYPLKQQSYWWSWCGKATFSGIEPNMKNMASPWIGFTRPSISAPNLADAMNTPERSKRNLGVVKPSGKLQERPCVMLFVVKGVNLFRAHKHTHIYKYILYFYTFLYKYYFAG